jgi:hypothetical protein
MPWKSEYAETRRKKYQEDEAERARRKEQGRTSEENKVYMAAYYKANRNKFGRTPEQQAKYNEQRKQRYATDPEYAEKIRAGTRGRDPAKRKDYRLQKTYGIDLADYQAMLERQSFACAICGAKHQDKRGKILHVDHCHATGAVRELLCTPCNTALGKLRDDVKRLQSAIAYLQRHSAKGAIE